MAWFDGPLLGFDLETTGIDTTRDLPVQAALVWTTADRVVRADTWIVDPGRDIPAEAIAIHGITSERARAEGCSLGEAALRIHSAIRQAAARGIPVVAMNASFDVTIAEALFASFGLPALAWHALLDPLVMDRHVDRYRKGKRRLDALCAHYRIQLQQAHDARADAEAAVALTRCIGLRYRECGDVHPELLTVRQAVWHEQWASEYDAWSRSEGLSGLEPDEFSWPCRRPPVLGPSVMTPELELARRRHPTLSFRHLSARSVA
ncbi:MAG TPA: exonuclease domain-containing protein [Acidimicrobiales bacterium]|nr:exonuclease domain-containing protein [Acidimicrobiales bacterium]